MDHIQRIGLLMQEAAHDGQGTVLLYAEVGDGVISADLFSQVQGGPVRFRFASAALKEAVLDFWKAETLSLRWAAMIMTVRNGTFSTDLRYADSLNASEGVEERRPRVVVENFGDAPVDYSSPNGV